jgi:hypothetical protein
MNPTTTTDIGADSPVSGQEETPSLRIDGEATGEEAARPLAMCEHIKPSGVRCGSPALRDHEFCYYHAKVRKTVPKNNLFVFLNNPGKENDPSYAFEFPYLEDAAAVQIGFMQFIYGVSQRRIEEWRARMILSALHGAAANVRQMDREAELAAKADPGQKTAGTEHATGIERSIDAPKKGPA